MVYLIKVSALIRVTKANKVRATLRFIIDLLSSDTQSSLILALWFLDWRLLLLIFFHFLLWLDLLNLFIIFILFILFFNGFFIFLLSEVIVESIGIALVKFTCNVVELMDICGGIEEKCEKRVINFVTFVLYLFFDCSGRLVFLQIMFALNFKHLIAEIFSFSIKLELNSQVIWFVIQKFYL